MVLSLHMEGAAVSLLRNSSLTLFTIIAIASGCSNGEDNSAFRKSKDQVEKPSQEPERAPGQAAEEEAVPFHQQLQGREDPIALYFKGAIERHKKLKKNTPRSQRVGTLDPLTGIYHGDYRTILAGVAAQQACDEIKTFAVSDDLVAPSNLDDLKRLVHLAVQLAQLKTLREKQEQGPLTKDERHQKSELEKLFAFPRLISVACPNDADKASEFFLAASFATRIKDQNDEVIREEVDLKNLELYAWDKGVKQAYQFYETFELEDGTIAVDPNPTRCLQCHLTPSSDAPLAMRMTPIMNELERPWTHWNVEPAGDSAKFHTDRAQDSLNYKELFLPDETNPDKKGPAPLFEDIIRAGHNKVITARLANVKLPIGLKKGEIPFEQAVDQVMGMLRPVFCIEQVQYVSEDAVKNDPNEVVNGNLFASVVVDPGYITAYSKLGISGKPWMEPLLSLQQGSTTPIEQVPVRGNSDRVLEERLLRPAPFNVLRPIDVIRARALDWRSVAFSDFRCGRWRQVKAEMKDPNFLPDLKKELLSFNPAPKVKDLGPVLYKRMMRFKDTSDPARPTFISLLLGDDPTTKDEQLTTPFLTVDMQAPGVKERIPEMVRRLKQNQLPNCANQPNEPICQATTESLSDMLTSHIERYTTAANGRETLIEDRNIRICYLTQHVTPEEEDVRFLDPNIEARMFNECCGLDPKLYLEVRSMVFGPNPGRLTNVRTQEKRRELLLAVKAKLEEELKKMSDPNAQQKLRDQVNCAVRAFKALRDPGDLEKWKANPDQNNNEHRICAANFAPERIAARPSLPEVDDCVSKSQAWGYDEELRSFQIQKQLEVMERSTR